MPGRAQRSGGECGPSGSWARRLVPLVAAVASRLRRRAALLHRRVRHRWRGRQRRESAPTGPAPSGSATDRTSDTARASGRSWSSRSAPRRPGTACPGEMSPRRSNEAAEARGRIRSRPPDRDRSARWSCAPSPPEQARALEVARSQGGCHGWQPDGRAQPRAPLSVPAAPDRRHGEPERGGACPAAGTIFRPAARERRELREAATAFRPGPVRTGARHGDRAPRGSDRDGTLGPLFSWISGKRGSV
jgi:hypothetical protein